MKYDIVMFLFFFAPMPVVDEEAFKVKFNDKLNRNRLATFYFLVKRCREKYFFVPKPR